MSELTPAQKRNNTPEGRKKSRVRNWQRLNHNKGDKSWDELYEEYLSVVKCPLCKVEFPDDFIAKHDNKKNLTRTRGIMCFSCNHKTKWLR